MLDLSFIIPVFNTKTLLKECLESCLNQDVDKSRYEIIVVDDGSTDGSAEVLKEYERLHSNVHYIYQENQKQGAARNRGLKRAQGKYIWYVDSDDSILDNVFGEILKVLTNEPTIQILRIKGERCLNGVCEQEGEVHKEHTFYSGQQLLEEDRYTVNMPFHIYSRDFLVNKVGDIMPRVYFEDNEYVIRSYIHCQVFYYLPLLAYRVRLTSSSTTRTTNFSHYFDLISVMTNMISLYKSQNLSELASSKFSERIASCMNKALIGLRNAPVREFVNLSRQFRSMKELGDIVSKSGSKAHALQYKLLRFPQTLKLLMKFYY